MVYCNKCGTENPDDSAFCSKCGARIGSSTSATDQVKTTDSNPIPSKGGDSQKLKYLAIVAVFIVVAAGILLAVGLNNDNDDLPQDNYDPVSGSWTYTAVPVVDDAETTFWNATLSIVVDDNVMTQYDQNVTKTLISTMDQESIDFTFGLIEAGGTGSGSTSLPGVVPPYRSEPEIIQDSYTYLEDYIDRNHISNVTNGSENVAVYQFDSQDGDRTLWVGSDGVIYRVVDSSGEVTLFYYLNGWESVKN